MKVEYDLHSGFVEFGWRHWLWVSAPKFFNLAFPGQRLEIEARKESRFDIFLQRIVLEWDGYPFVEQCGQVTSVGFFHS